MIKSCPGLEATPVNWKAATVTFDHGTQAEDVVAVSVVAVRGAAGGRDRPH